VFLGPAIRTRGEVMVFALDDEVEAEEWRILYTQVEALVRS
jgi:hypothetical protein